jgi:translation initiation factor IF-1
MSEKEQALELVGTVVEAFKAKFLVKTDSLPNSGATYEVLAHLSGKLRKNFIKIVPGDKVKVEVTPYDLTRGRITYRF